MSGIDFRAYVMLKRKYHEAQDLYDSILDEKMELFTRTQPNAVRYDTDKVMTNHDSNVLESYIIAMEQRHIEERLSEALKIKNERLQFLHDAEKELRESKEIHDVVYVCRFIDCMRIKKICKQTHYSKSAICNYLDYIKKQIGGA